MSDCDQNQEPMDLSRAVERTKGLQPWRRVFHAANGTLVVLSVAVLGLSAPAAARMLGGILAFTVLMDVVRLFDPKLNVLFFRAFASLASPRETKKVASSTWYALSAFLVLTLFPQDCALAGILVLAWADPAASVVGQKWGKRSFLGGTVRGTAAFVLVAFSALLVFVPWQLALVVAAVTALVEAAPTGLDDNLILPLTAAGLVFLLGG